jgi:hypothetical protein
VSESLKSKDFCILSKPEYKCDVESDYSFKCGIHICSNSMSKCIDYMFQYINKKLREEESFKSFKNVIKSCEYTFKVNSVCLNEQKCSEKKIVTTGFIVRYKTFTFDCKCPARLSFKCDLYCTADLQACDYFKSNVESRHSIKKC